MFRNNEFNTYLSTKITIISEKVPGLNAQVPCDQQWPGFRGPWARGFIETTGTPVSWSVDSSRNIRWVTPVPGLGHSCPVIWDDCLFVTSAVNLVHEESLKVGLYGDIDEADDSQEHAFTVFCVDLVHTCHLFQRR